MFFVTFSTILMYCELSLLISLSLSAGSDVTVLGYGSQIQILRQACEMAQSELGVSCELIDLRTILPWDEDTVIQVSATLFTLSLKF